MTFCLWLRCPSCPVDPFGHGGRRRHVSFYSFPPVKAVVEGNDRCGTCGGEMRPEEPGWVLEQRGLVGWR